MILVDDSRKKSFLLIVVLVVCAIFLLANYTGSNCEVLLQDILEKDLIIKNLTDELSCATKGTLPNGGFCMNNKNNMIGFGYDFDSKLCEGLEKIFGYSSVGDMGSSIGMYGACFLRLTNSIIALKDPEELKNFQQRFVQELQSTEMLNKTQVIRSWEGFEAASGVEEESKGLIHSADLSKPLDEKYLFDWVMSLEVGEHIPAEGEQNFLNNLVNHACKGVVVSWAVLGQGGYHHINNRPNEYIIQEMKERGMENDEEAQKELRNIVDIDYFKNTLMVFRFPQKRC